MAKPCCFRDSSPDAVLTLLPLCSTAFENRALGSTWLSGERRSPLQLLYDLDQTRPRDACLFPQAREFRAPTSRSTYSLPLAPCGPRCLRPFLHRGTGFSKSFTALVVRVKLAIHAHGDTQAHAPGGLPSLADFGPAEINRRLRAYLAFLFVREPFERLASAYRNKFARPYSDAFRRRYGTRIVRRLRPGAQPAALARGHDVRFAEFLGYLLDPRTRRDGPFNEHWERAHALCHPCRVRYDVVGKFETLAEDAAFVLDLVGEPGLSFPPPPRPKAAAVRDQAARLFQDISPFYQRRLFDLYKMDFLLFNYSAPSYLRLR
uniref:Carbohydrate sulfotransferase n=1 Tax=Chinchilla lanigera TaxID=34839 RepID=A0A8C2YLP0_CHILA